MKNGVSPDKESICSSSDYQPVHDQIIIDFEETDSGLSDPENVSMDLLQVNKPKKKKQKRQTRPNSSSSSVRSFASRLKSYNPSDSKRRSRRAS